MRGAVTALGADGEEIEIEPDEDGDLVAYVFKTLADPYTGPDQPASASTRGVARAPTRRSLNVTRGAKERIGQLADAAAARSIEHVDELGAGRHRRGREAEGDPRRRRARARKDAEISLPAARPAGAGDGVRLSSRRRRATRRRRRRRVRRLEEEDPTLDVHRDPQTGEQIIAGLTQVHVEVIVERMKRRFGAEIELHPPRVPYLETIRKPAKAHGRYKKQTGGRGQFGDCHIEIEPGRGGRRLRVRRTRSRAA